jgi:hypothetical protein
MTEPNDGEDLEPEPMTRQEARFYRERELADAAVLSVAARMPAPEPPPLKAAHPNAQLVNLTIRVDDYVLTHAR